MRMSRELLAVVREARSWSNLDPVGVGARDLRECLLIQIARSRARLRLFCGAGWQSPERLLRESGVIRVV